ncbi:MAG TPA: PaaI family thioesterase [Limnochordales bacterium]
MADGQPGFSRRLGIERIRAEEGHSELRLAIGPDHLNELGIVHGGVLMTLADEAIGMAAFTSVPPGTAVVTAELHVHFLMPARRGTLVARGHVWRAGRRLVTGEAVIELHDGHHPPEVVARATGTWATVTPAVPLPASE